MKNKKYNVRWEESHRVVVKADSEEEAIEKAMEGQGVDKGSEMTAMPEAEQV